MKPSDKLVTLAKCKNVRSKRKTIQYSMIAEQLKKIFDPFVSLNIQVWENFEKLGKVEELPKETVLKASNTKEKYFNIVLKGSGGNLIWNKNNFVCIDIAFENDSLFDFMSFKLQKSTPIEVRLFEDSRIFSVPYQNFQKTLIPGNFGENIMRLAAEESFIEKQQQQIDLLTKTAKVRYLELLQAKNEISKVPLKYMASFLGITPQSLSRIRAEKRSELPNGN
jgi:signal-transduction protein with cAMP-binding, CBS, and nucleotidyltransferase domain